MSRRHVTKPHKILNAVDISQNQTGEWSDVSNYDLIKYLIDWTGDAVGVLTIETSDDKSVVHTLDFGTVIAVNASFSPKQHAILVESIAHKYMRVNFAFTSGTGTLTSSITMTTKGA